VDARTDDQAIGGGIEREAAFRHQQNTRAAVTIIPTTIVVPESLSFLISNEES